MQRDLLINEGRDVALCNGVRGLKYRDKQQKASWLGRTL